MTNSKIILFDGYCIICDSAIYFLKKRITDETVLFIPSQSDEGEKLVEKYNLSESVKEAVVFIKDENVYLKSRAILEIMNFLPKSYRIFKFFKLLPNAITDKTYDIIARNRYRFFKKKTNLSCHHEI